MNFNKIREIFINFFFKQKVLKLFYFIINNFSLFKLNLNKTFILGISHIVTLSLQKEKYNLNFFQLNLFQMFIIIFIFTTLNAV